MLHGSQRVPSSNREHGSVLQIWGQFPLEGEVQISGSKNSALAIVAATLLSAGHCRLRNVPEVVDVIRMREILTSLGVKFEHSSGVLDIDARYLNQCHIPMDLACQLRASFFVIGPLLARLGEVQVPLPGGCAIGARPVDFHIHGLQAMGADIRLEQGIVYARIANGKKRLQGANITLGYPSVGATATLMMAATLADGETVIENAAQEPEIVDLANFCRAMGAQIVGAGTKRIVISGVPKLYSANHCIIPDRIEAGTFLIAGAITRSRLSVASVNPNHLVSLVAQLRAIGAVVFAESSDRLQIVPSHRPIATAIETHPYPGFPTDLQAPFMALLTRCEGRSLITETLFENRFQHVPELTRMGATIQVTGSHVLIQGVRKLMGTSVTATDLRAAAALVLAALAAEEMTTLAGLHHLDRGYEHLEDKLQKLGAKIQRIQPEPEPHSQPVSILSAPHQRQETIACCGVADKAIA